MANAYFSELILKEIFAKFCLCNYHNGSLDLYFGHKNFNLNIQVNVIVNIG